MEISYTYNEGGLNATAFFIWENNPYCKNWFDPPGNVIDLRNKILAEAKEQVLKNIALAIKYGDDESKLWDKWVSHTGTGGYYIDFSLEQTPPDGIYVFIDFHVDPGIGQKSHYVERQVDISELKL